MPSFSIAASRRSREHDLLVTTLQDRSRLAYMRYQGGVDTLLNALDADRDLFEAELGLAQARRNELLALVQLYRALGGGWPARCPCSSLAGVRLSARPSCLQS